MMKIPPIQQRKGSELAQEAILEHIRGHRLAPGAKLAPDRELALMLGCSRTVVREALKGLEAVGVIKMKVGKGIFVADFTLEGFLDKYHPVLFPLAGDLRCLTDARLAIELGIVDLAIARATAADLDRLRAVIKKMEQAGTDRKMQALDMVYHQTLARIARSPLLTEFSGVLRKFFVVAYEGANAAARPPAEVQRINAATHREHRALVEAIAAGDSRRARKLVAEHLAVPAAEPERRPKAEGKQSIQQGTVT